MMISNEMYESFYNDLEDKPDAIETSFEADIESDDTKVRPTRFSTPTAASLFFCLPIEQAETAITEIPKLPKIHVDIEGGLLRHDVR